MTKAVEVWADGACHPNPGTGGWGWHDSNGNQDSGGERESTNNRMEMTAILEALKTYPDGTKVKVYSDSQYCVNGLTIWRKKWQKANWHKKSDPMPNRDLWLKLETQLNRLNISFEWVKGHDGNAGNEKADALANKGRADVVAGLTDESPKVEHSAQIQAGYEAISHFTLKEAQERIIELESRLNHLEQAFIKLM